VNGQRSYDVPRESLMTLPGALGLAIWTDRRCLFVIDVYVFRPVVLTALAGMTTTCGRDILNDTLNSTELRPDRMGFLAGLLVASGYPISPEVFLDLCRTSERVVLLFWDAGVTRPSVSTCSTAEIAFEV
jgi:hypothetical protein